MPQQTVFPLRYGLQLPRGENVQGIEVFSEGGLDLTQSIIENRAGCASALINYEISLTGGYRRINGFKRYTLFAVPGEGPILGVIVFYPNGILAARKDIGANTYSLYGGLNWTKLNTITLNYKKGMVLQYDLYNWTGEYRIVVTDGVNPAYRWNGWKMTSLNATGSPTDPQFCKVHKGYMILAGYSSNFGAISLSAPLAEEDWAPVDGAGEIIIGDTITALKSWQTDLVVFGKKSITKVTGSSTDTTSSTPFVVSPVTNRIGCPEGRTIQEIDGDLVFLSPDGIRTISGTYKIGDTEIASISRPIQSIVSNINTVTSNCHSLVVHKKTQYRLFYPNPNDYESSCKGIIGGVRRFRDGHEAWEWGELKGFKPSCCDAGYLSDNREYIIHGGYDGFVYQQEVGNTLNGAPINENYETVPLELGDEGLRKSPRRATIFCVHEGNSKSLKFSALYNYGNSEVIQPLSQAVDNDPESFNAYDSGLKYNTEVKYSNTTITFEPVLHRKLLQGSGFNVKFKIGENVDVSTLDASYVIQGFYIEFFPAGRR